MRRLSQGRQRLILPEERYASPADRGHRTAERLPASDYIDVARATDEVADAPGSSALAMRTLTRIGQRSEPRWRAIWSRAPLAPSAVWNLGGLGILIASRHQLSALPSRAGRRSRLGALALAEWAILPSFSPALFRPVNMACKSRCQ